MKNERKKRTTIHIDNEIWNLARMKAKCSGSQLVEELLANYIGNDSNILEYEELIAQSEEIIRKEKANIKAYKKAISELENEMKANSTNIKLIGECRERIKQYHSRYKFVSVDFIVRLSKIKNIPVQVLNDIALNEGFTIKNVNDAKE